jgi:hypothetical protein
VIDVRGLARPRVDNARSPTPRNESLSTGNPFMLFGVLVEKRFGHASVRYESRRARFRSAFSAGIGSFSTCIRPRKPRALTLSRRSDFR